MNMCTVITAADFLIGFGLLFAGLTLGLAANLERIGRIAHWKASIERQSPITDLR